ncbi:hypothetical protein BDK51DRAFT_46901 [Blyttiomyces helicus]|uniref:Uncharacterized protein n=1 Tax=Blyttiomyces helicus TaxID=388810 RepID=A0A4P9WC26_9FUNG|nr:hypothetical protein BDK51DRAFT_46901 [Blyttiomyces helicus]|eukprot:RKO89195.1 hypothetical protein BDK51DRAFT_46901 [Blyttiomyces helicus]
MALPIIRAAIRTAPTTAIRLAAPARAQSTSVFARDNLVKFVPNVKFTPETTLGDLHEGLYVKYRYRLAYVAIGWTGLLYYLFWNPCVLFFGVEGRGEGGGAEGGGGWVCCGGTANER